MNNELEQFFIRKYEQLEEELEELKAVTWRSEGFSDLGSATYAVRCSVIDKFGMFSSLSNWGGYSVEDLEELLLMTDDELLEEAKAPCYFKGYEIIKMTTRRFPFTVAFDSYKGEKRFGYDPDDDPCQLHEIAPSPDFNAWTYRHNEKALASRAVEVVRKQVKERIEQVKERIEELKKKEEN